MSDFSLFMCIFFIIKNRINIILAKNQLPEEILKVLTGRWYHYHSQLPKKEIPYLCCRQGCDVWLSDLLVPKFKIKKTLFKKLILKGKNRNIEQK